MTNAEAMTALILERVCQGHNLEEATRLAMTDATRYVFSSFFDRIIKDFVHRSFIDVYMGGPIVHYTVKSDMALWRFLPPNT